MRGPENQADYSPLTPLQVEGLIVKNLPPVDHHGEAVERIGPDSIRVRLPYQPEYMGSEPWQDGAGRVFSGPWSWASPIPRCMPV